MKAYKKKSCLQINFQQICCEAKEQSVDIIKISGEKAKEKPQQIGCLLSSLPVNFLSVCALGKGHDHRNKCDIIYLLFIFCALNT